MKILPIALCFILTVMSLQSSYGAIDYGSKRDVKAKKLIADAAKKEMLLKKEQDNTTKSILNAVAEKIKSKYKKFNINITVENGTVTLAGYVGDEETKQNIERDVSKIRDVKNVKNNLKVQQEPKK